MMAQIVKRVLIVGVATALPAGGAMADGAGHLASWLDGEFNNYAQVWQQRVDGIEQPSANFHYRFVTVDSSEGEPTLVAERYEVGNAQNGARYLLRLTAGEGGTVRQSASTLEGPAGEGDADALRELAAAGSIGRAPGCDALWRFTGTEWIASAPRAGCLLYAQHDGEALRLNETMLRTRDSSALGDFANRRVRYFRGWMGVKRQRWDPAAADDDWVFMPRYRIHNEGGVVRLVEKDGTPTGYAIKLERLVYQNTNTPVLKLGLIDESEDYTLTYTWTQPGSIRIGMNLRWFQAGLTAE